MTGRLFVVDTNVVVAGLITSEPAAPTRTILDRMLSGRLRFVLSDDLLDEYREVLVRPAIRAAHGLALEEVEEILVELVASAVMAPTGEGEARRSRRSDVHLDALLELFPKSILVSGDHEARTRAGARGLTPREMIERVDEP